MVISIFYVYVSYRPWSWLLNLTLSRRCYLYFLCLCLVPLSSPYLFVLALSLCLVLLLLVASPVSPGIGSLFCCSSRYLCLVLSVGFIPP
jgi:hypothetical protein